MDDVEGFAFFARQPDRPPPSIPAEIVADLARYMEEKARCQEADTSARALPDEVFPRTATELRSMADYLRQLYRDEARRLSVDV